MRKIFRFAQTPNASVRSQNASPAPSKAERHAAYNAGKSTNAATITGAAAGDVHKRSAKITAMVGRVRNTETRGAKKARTAGYRREKSASVPPQANEQTKATAVRKNVAPNARQNSPLPNSAKADLTVCPNEGSKYSLPIA